MSKTIKRLLWQRTLETAGPLRQPLPKAPDQAWEGFFGRMQAILDRSDERKRQQLREQRLRPFAAPAFLDALGQAIAELNKPRRWAPGAYITGPVVDLSRGGFIEGNQVRLVGEGGPVAAVKVNGNAALLASHLRDLGFEDLEGSTCD